MTTSKAKSIQSLDFIGLLLGVGSLVPRIGPTFVLCQVLVPVIVGILEGVRRVQRVQSVHVLPLIRHAVVVIILILIVTYPVAVGVHPFIRVLGELVPVVTYPVAVRIGGLVRVVGKGVLRVEDPVAVRIRFIDGCKSEYICCVQYGSSVDVLQPLLDLHNIVITVEKPGGEEVHPGGGPSGVRPVDRIREGYVHIHLHIVLLPEVEGCREGLNIYPDPHTYPYG